MGERYWVTGVQLGMLIAIPEVEERKLLVENIVDAQFIGDTKKLKDLLSTESVMGEIQCVRCKHYFNLSEGQRCLDMAWRCKRCILDNAQENKMATSRETADSRTTAKSGFEGSTNTPETSIHDKIKEQLK